MSKDKTAQQLIDELAGLARAEYSSSSYLRPRTAQWYVRQGKEIPERLLPGRAIMRLSEEDRSLLLDLKPEDTVDPALMWTQVESGRYNSIKPSLTRQGRFNLS